MLVKKIISVLAAGLLLSGMLTACGETETAETTGDTAADTAQNVEAVPVILTEGQTAKFKIVRAEDANDAVVDAAIDFRKSLTELTGVNFEFGTDWTKKGTEVDETQPEILLGVTNRAASQAAAGELNAIQYRIDAVGNKIVICGINQMSMEAAVEHVFKNNMITLDANGCFVFSGFPVTAEVQFGDGQVPTYLYGNVEVFESSGGTYVMKATDTTADQYREYLGYLEAAGFTLYTDNQIKDNLFATYVSDQLQVNAYYIAPNNTARVIWEPRGVLPILEADNKYEEKTTTTLTSINLETVKVNEGASHVIRLADGTFFIVDGGFADDNGVEAEKLYEVLVKQTPEGEKPVIAAWFMSHCHGDHIGTFNDFAIRYHDKTVVESFIYNFPKDEEIAASDSPYMLDDSLPRYTMFRKVIADYYSDVPVIKPHTGNVIYVKNMKMEILGTLEDCYPMSIVNYGMNYSTTLFKSTIEGQTMLWLGDLQTNAGMLAIEQFGDYLQSDMMQVGHHGYGGSGFVELYQTIDPTYVIWPVCWGDFFSTSGSDYNQWFLNSEKVKHVMVSGFGTNTITLPYESEEGIQKYPDRRWKNPEYWD
ncbi:MAG: hypothetical protein IJF78_06350 [Clostridia bacterium]|nr:hypothetical protein [Clostridia bacterium]